MAFYDKSARMMYAVGLSLVIHVVLIGLLVGTQVFSGDSPKDESVETTEPEKPKDAPEPEKPSEEASSVESAPIQPQLPEQTERPEPESVIKPRPKKEMKARAAAKEKAEVAETEIYVVKKGESLSSIARAHGCTLAELTKLNKATLKKNKCLFIGAKLRVPKK